MSISFIRMIPGLVMVLFLLLACDNQKGQPDEISPELRESIIRVNKKLTSSESEEINTYIRKKGLNMKATGTGLRYMIIKEGQGEHARSGMLATVHFKLGLLNGKQCYSSDSTGAETFRIDNDEVESGLHEGIKLLKVGDRAKFILPSHLAHGLAGDHKCITARSPVVYEIELIELK